MGKGRQAVPIDVAPKSMGTLRFAHPTAKRPDFGGLSNAAHRVLRTSGQSQELAAGGLCPPLDFCYAAMASTTADPPDIVARGIEAGE
jgi:hypothetical protein